MTQIPYDIKVAVIYNKIGHDPKQGTYKPNPEWNDDGRTNTIMGLLLTNLPRNSTYKTLTDIGSGSGKFAALLSPYFDQIVSVEPNADFVKQQEALIQELNLENVDIYQDGMPDCLAKINSQAVLVSGALYLTEDWSKSYELLLLDTTVSWLAIFDGPDLDTFDASLFHGSYGELSKRKPIVKGDEWLMFKTAEEQGWAARLFDIDKDEAMTEGDLADRWLLILER